tara:strand:+ start:1903 stop:2061 length:159 start_codon:yes stop_codon:yes gene_type:complete
MDAYDNYIDLLMEKGLSAKLSTELSDAHTEYLEKMGDAHDEVRTDREKEETN